MGTTLSVLISIDDNVFIGHIGDSRIYYFHDKKQKIYPLTKDHTVVQMLFEQGHLKKEELANHPYRNILAQSLGTSQKVSADIIEYKLPFSGFLLLCSDGLTDEISEEEIKVVMFEQTNINQKANKLLETVLSRTAKDNVSFILIRR